MQHRIIVVDARSDIPLAEAQRHWRERHAGVYAPTPQLAGYVQNRPLEEEWERLGRRSVCSETWFADHDAERASFASDYYRDVVMPDEGSFLDRGSAWMGRVLDEPPWEQPRARYRVLAFGAETLLWDGQADRHVVDRDPAGGGARVVLSAWLDDRHEALTVARASGVFAFAAEPAVVVAPTVARG